MSILVTGGAGYIGSHVVKDLQRKNFEVVVLDDLSSGNRWANSDCELLKIDLLDVKRLSQKLNKRKFNAVFHFAAKSIVNESNKNPMKYYLNNIAGTMNLIDLMLKNDNSNLIFSSSAAVYGAPKKMPISEDVPKNPINYYGKSKLIVERILRDLQKIYKMNIICYRYFNASGADESLMIGESRKKETHLIPNILNSITQRGHLKVFGKNYNTPDGTCIRDYVHVSDISEGHILGLNHLNKNCGFDVFNLGNALGFSILEVIKMAEKVTKKQVKFSFFDKRKNDPAFLIADNKKAFKILNWAPKFSDLENIIKSSWDWHMLQNVGSK